MAYAAFTTLAFLMALSFLKHGDKGSARANIYLVDDVEGYGQRFDGIGGISGGGATSKLLINYPPKQRDEILDYLFKPFFGASLQILKVEIGGDAQSTDGTESSHMHNENEENYETGYEWFLMKEAKKRNPDIKLGALAWAFPGWVGEIPRKPYANFTKLSHYLTRWLIGAKSRYGLQIDYVGIWNEQECDKEFVKYFREYLNEHGFREIKLVAPDSYDLEWTVTKQMQKDPDFSDAFDIIGEHYPGTKSTPEARHTNKVLWSSEDFSTLNDRIGAGCWARILNQNYVNGYMSATLSWNLIYSYYEGLPYGGCGLLTANTPWSGNYYVSLPIWVTAHTTHFAQPGWHYLKHGRGVGLLDAGGSYVTLTTKSSSSSSIPTDATIGPNGSFANSTSLNELTIVIETLTFDNSKCIRPKLEPYEVADWQVVQFLLGGSFKYLKSLNVWRTDLSPGVVSETERPIFELLQPIAVENGIITINVQANNLYTLTTVEREPPVPYRDIPLPTDFPIPYTDNFEDYIDFAEPYNIAPQVGVFEIRTPKDAIKSNDGKSNKVVAQVVEQTPIHWCMGNKLAMPSPSAFVGDFKWSNVDVSVDIQWPTQSAKVSQQSPSVKLTSDASSHVKSSYGPHDPFPPAYLAVRVDRGGCETLKAEGVYFWIQPSRATFLVTADLKATKTLFKGPLGEFDPYQLNTVRLVVKDKHALGYVNGVLTFSGNMSIYSTHGFVAFGTWDYSLVYFDNFNISRAESTSVTSGSFLSHFF